METKVFSFPESGGCGTGMLGYLAPLLRQNGLDPNMVFAMMNGRNNNGFGDGAWFLWIIVILALFRNGFWGGNGNGAVEAACNGNGCGLLSNYIATGNQSALSELSATLHCDVSALQTAINSVMASVQNVGNQVGMSGQQVINAIQLGNNTLASQLASCCCDIREAITRQGYENQLATVNQTNALQGSINNVNTSVERGFASTAFETAQQTCDLKNAITAQTTFISDKFCQLEMREMQNKIDALRTENQNLRFAESQQAQNAYLINQLQPVAKPCYLTCSPYQAAQYPYGFPYGGYPYGYPYGNYGANAANNGGCNCGCGY